MSNFLQNMRDVWQRTGLAQRVLLLTVLLVTAGAAALLVDWARRPSLALLYTGLEPQEAARVVEKIRDAGVAYELRSGGAAIYVAEDKVYTLRLELAGQGLPAGDQRGYRLLDEEKIGTSPFTQRLNYRRALEGEIAKSIQVLEGVVSARVHVVRPESSLFGGQEKASSATVVLKLKPGWHLAPGNVAAIVHMVAGGVEGLKAENVVVVDSTGTLLSNGAQDAFTKGIGTFLDFKAQHEEYLARKIEDMLTQVLGPNRASVRVGIILDNSSKTETTETFDPSAKVTTKEETKSKSASGGAAPAEAAAAGNTKEETILTDYAVGRTVKQEVLVPGKVTSISVAAMVDLSAPAAPPPAEGGATPAAPPPAPTLKVADIETVIRSALSLKETDLVKVVDTPFHRAAAETPAEEDKTAEARTFYLDIARHASLGVLVIGALVTLKIFGGSKKRAGAAALAAGQAGAAALPPGAGGSGMAGLGEGDAAMLRGRITSALQENPEEMRRLFLTWAEGDKGGA